MPRRRRVIFVVVPLCLLGLPLVACDKDRAPPAGLPPLTTGESPTAPIAAPGVHAVHDPSSGVGMPAGHPALPPGHPATGQGEGGEGPFDGKKMPGPGTDFDPAAKLAGTLELAPAVKDKVAPGDVIFVVARQDDGSDKGSILGVKRLVAGAWPLAVEIDGRDAMSPGSKFAGKVLLTARVDKDGDAMTKNPGDLFGAAHLTVPDSRVKLTIDKIQQ